MLKKYFYMVLDVLNLSFRDERGVSQTIYYVRKRRGAYQAYVYIRGGGVSNYGQFRAYVLIE